MSNEALKQPIEKVQIQPAPELDRARYERILGQITQQPTITSISLFFATTSLISIIGGTEYRYTDGSKILISELKRNKARIFKISQETPYNSRNDKPINMYEIRLNEDLLYSFESEGRNLTKTSYHQSNTTDMSLTGEQEIDPAI